MPGPQDTRRPRAHSIPKTERPEPRGNEVRIQEVAPAPIPRIPVVTPRDVAQLGDRKRAEVPRPVTAPSAVPFKVEPAGDPGGRVSEDRPRRRR